MTQPTAPTAARPSDVLDVLMPVRSVTVQEIAPGVVRAHVRPETARYAAALLLQAGYDVARSADDLTITVTAEPTTDTAGTTTEHPYGAEWVARHEAAARANARVDDGIVSSRHGRRCLTEAVDGECVCR